MAEVILYLARKGNKAPEWIIQPDAPQVTAALKAAIERDWPFISHIEFAAAAADGNSDQVFMQKMEAMLRAHPGHPFVLIHLGQLSADEAAQLIGAHGNIYFIPSHANPVKVYQSGQPWTNMFDGTEERLAPRWRQLSLIYPDRFILGFDNVWA